MALETAEEFVRTLQECVRIAPPDNAYFAPDETQRRVEARDAAVRRELLDELADAVRGNGTDGMRFADSYIAAMSKLRAKYAKEPG